MALNEADEDPLSQEPARISVQQAEHALEALGNLLYLIEIDHSNQDHLEAYLIMTRNAMETLNKWFYGERRIDPV